MDPLTQTIALLRPRALLWKQADAVGDWAVRFPSHDGAAFSLIARGSCVFQAPGRAPTTLNEGDFVLLTRPPPWTLGARAESLAVDFRRDYATSGQWTALAEPDSDQPVTRLLGGHFHFDAANAALLEGLLPPIVEIRAADPGAARVRAVLDLIGDEGGAERPGRALVMERLVEVMLVEAIRHAARVDADGQQGLLAGLGDAKIAAALRAVHEDIRRPWTVAQLAAIAGMSRSVFAERFSRRLGLPPIDYLLRWRMALAKDALRQGDRRLAEVAETCGYQSVSAFSAAFTRTVGCPPSRYANSPPSSTEARASLT